jgi:hypothetical protein
MSKPVVILWGAISALYVVALVTFAGIFGAGYLIDDRGPLRSLAQLAFLVSLPLLLAVIIAAFIRPTRNRLIWAALALCSWPAGLAMSSLAQPYTRDYFFRSRLADFQSLADATLESRHIRTFWTSPDGYRLLNRRLIAVPAESRSDSLWGKPLESLDEVLQSEEISADEYHALVSRLQALQLRRVAVDSDYLLLGGRDAGFVYLRTGAKPRHEGDDLDGPGSPHLRKRYTEQWYYATW